MPLTFGQQLRKLRNTRGFTQQRLAEVILGTPARSGEISKWEADIHTPSTIHLMQLAVVLEARIDTLVALAIADAG